MICAVISLILVVSGLFAEDGVILIAAALFAIASNVEIKINIGGNDHD